MNDDIEATGPPPSSARATNASSPRPLRRTLAALSLALFGIIIAVLPLTSFVAGIISCDGDTSNTECSLGVTVVGFILVPALGWSLTALTGAFALWRQRRPSRLIFAGPAVSAGLLVLANVGWMLLGMLVRH